MPFYFFTLNSVAWNWWVREQTTSQQIKYFRYKNTTIILRFFIRNGNIVWNFNIWNLSSVIPSARRQRKATNYLHMSLIFAPQSFDRCGRKISQLSSISRRLTTWWRCHHFSLSRLLVTRWTKALHSCLLSTSSHSSFNPFPVSVRMPSIHRILCLPLLLLPPTFPSIISFSIPFLLITCPK